MGVFRNWSGRAIRLVGAVAGSSVALAQDSDIQQQLANPVTSLTLVPIQVNYDRGIGPVGNGSRVTTNVQPVIPFKLSDQ